jgi:hypothetical protein
MILRMFFNIKYFKSALAFNKDARELWGTLDSFGVEPMHEPGLFRVRHPILVMI